MLCRVLIKEKVRGLNLQPGEVKDVPDIDVPDLVKRGVVEPVARKKHTTLVEESAFPRGARVLVKMPEGH